MFIFDLMYLLHFDRSFGIGSASLRTARMGSITRQLNHHFIVRWNEDNATRRWQAFHLDGLDGGNVSFQTLHQHVAIATYTI